MCGKWSLGGRTVSHEKWVNSGDVRLAWSTAVTAFRKWKQQEETKTRPRLNLMPLAPERNAAIFTEPTFVAMKTAYINMLAKNYSPKLKPPPRPKAYKPRGRPSYTIDTSSSEDYEDSDDDDLPTPPSRKRSIAEIQRKPPPQYFPPASSARPPPPPPQYSAPSAPAPTFLAHEPPASVAPPPSTSPTPFATKITRHSAPTAAPPSNPTHPYSYTPPATTPGVSSLKPAYKKAKLVEESESKSEEPQLVRPSVNSALILSLINEQINQLEEEVNLQLRNARRRIAHLCGLLNATS